MPQQHEMFGPPPLTVTPTPGAIGPRLWVKRLAIWKAPGGEKIRDVKLAPGLNIVWSPEGTAGSPFGEEESAVAHGSGKTLFCRLIRYCLGEDRFANEEQRVIIASAFPDGIVGSEIVLDGIAWAVLRPLGLRRRHIAMAGGDLDEIAAGGGSSTGIEPLIAAIEETILTPAVRELLRTGADGAIWPVALAWLTRDQECRFDDVLDWRSPSSESNSPMPATGREKGPRLEALRAFLGAIVPEERNARTREHNLDEQRRTLEQEIGHRRWQLGRTQTRLETQLGLEPPLPEMPLLLDLMRNVAEERFAAASKLPSGDRTVLTAAREELQRAQLESARLEEERVRCEATLPVEERLLQSIRQEIPGLSYSKNEAESPVCQVCEVPIDRALAEGCKLSHKLPDAEGWRQRWAERNADLERQGRRVLELRAMIGPARERAAMGRQVVDRLTQRVIAIEMADDERSAAWYSARRLRDDIDRFGDRVSAQESALISARDIDSKLQAERAFLLSLRDKQGRLFGRLQEKFIPIVRRLLGPNATGSVALTGKGLELGVDLGGNRKTAAIESLKVLSFDIACLCLSIEGTTHVPAFLLHDSPREADLGLSIYYELFQLMVELESHVNGPHFQYILTTTTPPPDTLKADPRVRIVIRGSPPQERLLRVNL